MRRKIAKRIRKNILKLDCTVEKEEWIREPDWKRKDCGYSAKVKCNGWTIDALGKDELEAFQMALETANDIKNHPEIFPSR